MSVNISADIDELLLKGNECKDQGDYDSAIEYYNKAIELDPSNAQVYNNRGLAWTKKRNYKKAIKDFGDSIKLNPELAITFSNRGMAWLKKGNSTRAFDNFSWAIEIDPKCTEARKNQRDMTERFDGGSFFAAFRRKPKFPKK